MHSSKTGILMYWTLKTIIMRDLKLIQIPSYNKAKKCIDTQSLACVEFKQALENKRKFE